MYSGEIIALIVAVSWTVTALFAETASKRIGSLTANIIRMALSLVMLSAFLWIATGTPYPTCTDRATWLWLAASGLVGYAFGDTCLFNSYLLIGSRFGQLLMTLSSVFAALAGYIILGEHLSWKVLIAMAITLFGIGLSVMGKRDDNGSEKSSDNGSNGSNYDSASGSIRQESAAACSSKKVGSHMSIGLKLPLKGILLGIGAALGQGVGLVLSKQGMLCYNDSIGSDATLLAVAPFAGTFIRAIFGLATFLAMALMQRKTRELRMAFSDRKGLGAITIATIFGPFIGVSLSLMAVEYTSTGIAQTIMALTPVLILLPARIFYHQKITTKEVIGANISVIGVSTFFIL